MFDILADKWTHPGDAVSPIVTFDISSLTAETADSAVSKIHKYGADVLYITCSARYSGVETLNAVFAAMQKRFMYAYIDEKIVCAETGFDDLAATEYNPMLRSSTLRVAEADEIEAGEEVVIKAELLIKDGLAAEKKNADPESLKSCSVIQTPMEEAEYNLLLPEAGEIICGAFDAFYEKLESSGYDNTVRGFVSGRLSALSEKKLYWSYGMDEVFFSFDGTDSMLASLVLGTDDKRLRKEAERLYAKTLAHMLDICYCKPMYDWCRRKNLLFAGEVPYRFIATCGRRYHIPIITRDFSAETKDDKGFMAAVKAFGDMARGEGSVGCAYRCTQTDLDDLVKEASLFHMASGTVIFLPEYFSSTDELEKLPFTMADIKQVHARLKRLSMLSFACKGRGDTAVLFEDGFIPFAGAEKLLDGGYAFAFVPVSQAMERGDVRQGVMYLDKFEYRTLLIEPRVRLSPMEIKKLGEVPAFGGEMYRGASFGEYMRKHGTSSTVKGTKGESLMRYDTVKSGVAFTAVLNTGDSPVTLELPWEENGSPYEFPFDKNITKYVRVTEKEGRRVLEARRLLPWECVVYAENSMERAYVSATAYNPTVREIIALKPGENHITNCHSDAVHMTLEADSIGAIPLAVTVKNTATDETIAQGRVVSVPYKLDLSSDICKEYTVIIEGSPRSASLRLEALCE